MREAGGGADRWQAEMAALREIALGAGLAEAVKWGKPCFTWKGANVAILQPFRDECRLMFFKGALLDDPAALLSSQGANTQSALVYRARDTGGIARDAAALKALLAAAVAVEEQGLKAPMPARHDPAYPQELIDRMDGDPAFADAFAALTPGRQRSWLLHFAGARQPATRAARIEKAVAEVLAGKGRNDR